MDPFTLALVWSLGGAAALVVLGLLTWGTVRRWITRRSAVGDYAELLQRRLESGEYVVVAGVFAADGTQRAAQTWQVDSIDDALAARLGKPGEAIRVQT
ncbi:hypothetical protein [Yinghuangia soli]|uniref:Uncharacterized protein n=1 Tax=Yinghuangia soli TaxID=2908204 RepID=A0AA41U0J6_9ACTN|nr:hypothetical protein [Yinghuangia soli]MCF2528661.1 hypothetical protein [Yinghuangia soli]